MASYTQDQLIERFSMISDDLQEAVSSVPSAEKQSAIGKRHGLANDKMASLGLEIGLVLLGFTHPKDFVKNVRDRVNVSAEQAADIARDVLREIFLSVENELRDLHNIMSGPLMSLESGGLSSLASRPKVKTIWESMNTTKPLSTKPKTIWDAIKKS